MKFRITPLLLLAGFTLAGAAHAAEPQASDTTYSTYAGVTVAIDAKTGKLRPLTAAESQRLSNKMLKTPQDRALAGRYAKQPRNAAETRATVRKSVRSGVSAKLPEDQMTQMNATVDAAGSVQLSEGDSPSAAAQEVTE